MITIDTIAAENQIADICTSDRNWTVKSMISR